MPLTDTDLSILKQCAISAALQAGRIIMSNITNSHEVQNKSGASSLASQVVTETDIMSQECILSVLEPTVQKYDLALLTEESADDRSRFDKDYFWCIDPIDGTLPFIENVHGFSVSIALVAKDAVPMLGVVYDPFMNILYHACKGQNAFRNNEVWHADERLEGTLSWIMDRSFRGHRFYSETEAELQQLCSELSLSPKPADIAQAGAALSACWVLEHSPAVYFKYPREKEGGGSLWDYAASACIFQSAGGWVSDMYGNPLELNRKQSTFMNHNGFVFASNSGLAEAIIALFENKFQ